MDSCREINTVKTNKTAKREAALSLSDVLASAGLLIGFLFYCAGSLADRAVRSVRSGRFAYFMGLRRRVIYGVGAGIAVFALIGAVGGIEAGLISLAVGTPLCIALAVLIKLLADD